ncbi:MAG: class I SAM-dependent methyltransferase [Acidobacteria bacterium]|nr:class I SAM-dependent methyltransferase [Acidobacteriota bacterium]
MTRDPAYFERKERFREWDHPVVRSFAEQRLRFLQSWLDLDGIESAMDVGCGNGASTQALASHIPTAGGLDASLDMLLRHPMRSGGRILYGDATALPLPDRSFDLVYGWEMLHHLPDPSLAIGEMARVSRRYVLVAEPNPWNPAQFAFALLDPEHRMVLRYRLQYLRELFRGAGLQVEKTGSGGWLFPNVTPSWLAPLLQKVPYSFPLGISNWILGRKDA